MRPQSLFPLYAPVASLKGVGPRIAPLVVRAAGPIVRDLAYLTPTELIERRATKVAGAANDEMVLLEVVIEGHLPPMRKGQPWRIRAYDDSGDITLVWFRGFGPHLEQAHPPGSLRLVSGKVERFGADPQIAHPDYLLPPERRGEILLVEPVYPGTAGLSPRVLRRLAAAAAERAPNLPEWQDAAWIQRMGWPAWRGALIALHRPVSQADLLPMAPVRQRLAFDELLAHQLAMARRKVLRRAEPAEPVRQGTWSNKLQADLPFQLTGAQLARSWIFAPTCHPASRCDGCCRATSVRARQWSPCWR